jgi:hypothetical protein
MKIEQQQNVARELLHKLEIIDPHCILAGGAPRNWFLGKVANDLDFYIHLPSNESLYATKLRFERLGLEVRHVSYKSDSWKQYKVMEHLFRIYEGIYKEQRIQIMVMRESTFQSVVSEFGVSICQFWWKGHKINATAMSLVSLLEKTLFVKDDYSAKEIHVAKMVKYFPDFEVKSFTDLWGVLEKYKRDYNLYKEKHDSYWHWTGFENYLEKMLNEQNNR